MKPEETASLREFRLYELLRRASLDDSILLGSQDWLRVEADINALWPDFGKRLYELHTHLSDHELRICWLIRMRIPPKGMATILKCSKPAITNARVRLYQKLHGTQGKAHMLDEFIRSL